MLHFSGNPECPLRTHQLHVSEAETEDEFRELRAEFPDDYCSACAPGKGRTDSERYAELRALVEAWQHWQREPRYDQADAPERLMDWSHR